MFQERNPPQEPPCDTCRVELDRNNQEAVKIYNLVHGQVLLRFDGERDHIVDLNHLALWKMIEMYRIKNPAEVFERIYRTFHELLIKAYEKGDDQ